jgi:Arc/MetJ-type ribon-helix-helix transcriptional regulator
MRQPTGAARRARIALRLSQEDRDQIERAVKSRGYESPSALIRAAIRNELNGQPELSEAEQRIAGGVERIAREITRFARGQQAVFALLDALAKTILTCMPEPPADSRPQAIARAKERYHRLMKTAGQSMSNSAQAAMQDLTNHGTN